MGDVLKFPNRPKSVKSNKNDKMDHELDIARECMHSIVKTLTDYRYYPQYDEQLTRDLALIYHMLYATMLRVDGQYHQFHSMMDYIMDELEFQIDTEDE